MLTDEKIFIRWKLIDGKKIPFGLDGAFGISAKSGNFAEASFELPQGEGVGIVFDENVPVAFIDIDGYDESFLVQQNLLRLFSKKAFIERSVSKNGYHIIARVDNKNVFSHLKTAKFDFYFQDRFCALTMDKTLESLDLSEVLQSDCTSLFSKVFKALQLVVEKDVPEVVNHLRKGVVETFDSPSEYDYALVKLVMKYTSDFETVQGLMLLSESDLIRIKYEKEPKCWRDDYVLTTLKAVMKQWSRFLVTDSFDFDKWQADNIIFIQNKPIVRKRAFTVVRSLTGIGKGHYVLSLLASLFQGAKHTLGAYSVNGNWSMLYVDTEMGFDLTARMRDVFMRKVGRDVKDKATFASVKELKVDERMAVISKLTSDLKPSVVVIDGLRDLVFNFNDIIQSYSIIQELEKLTTMNDCAVIGTIHLNVGQDVPKSRGHLGSEIEQKAFTVLHIEREDESGMITVKHAKGRTGHFDSYEIRFDQQEGYLVGSNENVAKSHTPF